MLTPGNAKAFAILAILFDLYGDNATDLSVEPSINGRENGFHVRGRKNRFHVTFCEARGSDQICVYYGESTAFNMQGNGPANDDVYRNQVQRFDCNQYVDAAEWIKDYLDQPND